MNPYINQGNPSNPYYQQNIYNQQNFMGNLPPELQNMQFDQQNNSILMANMMAKKQMYGQPQAQQQQVQQQQPQPQPQLPFNSPGGSSNPSVTGSPALSNMQSPQQRQPMIMNPQQPMMQQSPPPQQQLQQQVWANKQMPLMGMQQMNEQQRQQFLMMQQQQFLNRKQPFQQPQIPSQQPQQPMTIPSTSMSPKTNHTSSPIPPVESIDTDINTKKVDAIISLNIELIRLCIESQRIGSNLEPNLALYQAKLQSNLTYLATMADVSMAKAGEDYKAPPPPDFSALPQPQSEIGKKIHEMYNAARKLFENQNQSPQQPSSQSQSPSLQRNSNQQQLLLRQQAAAMRQQQQQQFLRNSSKSGSNSASSSVVNTPNNMNIPLNGIPSNTNAMDPQSVLRQQQQLRQQQMMMGMTMASPTNSNPSTIAGFSPNISSPAISLPSTQQQINPSDLLAANGMMNPTMMNPNNIMMNPNNMMMNSNNIMNNMYNGNLEDPNNYNMMMMMQRLQQSSQNQ